eukprot:TRINITY_DN110040_c0_g1_i1.p1 TRINITY_DN110040_c0_g1~~TRINITY_DN110040_c0_g1_i1.p1  ORF type:complete len:291 (+),score=30.68 TRINITY_DN110040_c0_g1_i1:37-909(+)
MAQKHSCAAMEKRKRCRAGPRWRLAALVNAGSLLTLGSCCFGRPASLIDPSSELKLHASRAILHLNVVPAVSGTQSLPEGVTPLSFLGRTIGGSFAVQWDGSPWGPYMEVGLLSSLVIAAGTWGAWASHVWVDSDEAAEGGRRIWGLPTAKCDIKVEEALDGSVLAFGTAPLIHIGDGVGPLGRIDRPASVVIGQLPWLEASHESGLEVTLPNLSGGLPFSKGDGKSGTTDLLSYPLHLQPKAVRLLSGHVVTGGKGVVPKVDFSNWWPLLSIELQDIDVTAGVPRTLSR